MMSVEHRRPSFTIGTDKLPALSTIKPPPAGPVYTAVFGVGSIGGMMLVGALIGPRPGGSAPLLPAPRRTGRSRL